jgi:hypothetical protein
VRPFGCFDKPDRRRYQGAHLRPARSLVCEYSAGFLAGGAAVAPLAANEFPEEGRGPEQAQGGPATFWVHLSGGACSLGLVVSSLGAAAFAALHGSAFARSLVGSSAAFSASAKVPAFGSVPIPLITCSCSTSRFPCCWVRHLNDSEQITYIGPPSLRHLFDSATDLVVQFRI